MPEANWERSDYESRIDLRADDIQSFVTSVLATIDEQAARQSPRCWDQVCQYFAGCAHAAIAQGATPCAGGKRIARYLKDAFPSSSEGSNTGFFEFMDWLSNPEKFNPRALRSALEQC